MLVQFRARRVEDRLAACLRVAPALAGRLGRPPGTGRCDAAIDAAVTSLRQHRPVEATDLPPEIARLFEALQGPNARFVESDDAIYPSNTAAALRPRTKVLLTCGTNDAQVPCATTNALTTALRHAHAGEPGRVTLPGADHLMHDADHPNTLTPLVLDALHRFTRH